MAQKQSRGPVSGTRKNVRRAKRAALIVGAVKARKRATRRRAAAEAMPESPRSMSTSTKSAKMPRKARIGKR